MKNAIEKLYELGQSIWCDNISRSMIDGGELERLVKLGVVGVTSNPTIFMKAITGSSDYDTRIQDLLARGCEGMALYEGLVVPDIADAADILRPVFDRTHGVDGYVSLEVNPKLAFDTGRTVDEARRLARMLGRPNVLIKVPATREGIPAIQTLIGEGISVNVTLIFSVNMYQAVMGAYVNGLKHFQDNGGDLSTVSSVASFFVSRIDTAIDKQLKNIEAQNQDVTQLYGQVAIANAKVAYAAYETVFGSSGDFAALAGARVQRPLWASTSTKNPNYSPTMYVDGLVGPDTVNTLPPQTIDVVLKQESFRHTILEGLAEAREILNRLKGVGISLDSVTDKLTLDGVDSFAASFDELLANLAQKQEQLRAAS